MTATQFHLILSIVGVLVADCFFPIFKESYSWWLVPVMLIGIFVCLVIIQALAFVITIAATNLNKPSKGEKFLRFQAKYFVPVIFKAVRAKVHTEGMEKLPEDNNILFVCNHQHNVDPAVFYYCFPDKNISFIGKKDIITQIPFIAKAMHKLNSLFIDRENDREAAKTIVAAIKRLKAKENSIGLFPEGYSSKNCELLPFRNGSFKIALKAKVPVAVCVINGTREITKKMFLKRTDITFRLLDVIYPETYENMSTSELGDLIHEQMETALEEIRK